MFYGLFFLAPESQNWSSNLNFCEEHNWKVFFSSQHIQFQYILITFQT